MYRLGVIKTHPLWSAFCVSPYPFSETGKELYHNQYMTTSYRSLTLLSVAVFALLSYNFMSASWTAPTGIPPANNTEAPINVSATTQAKVGNLSANIFAAVSQMRSNLYCDALGNNCFAPGEVGTASSTAQICPRQQLMIGINADGSIRCETMPRSGDVVGQYCGDCPRGCTLLQGGGQCTTNQSYVYCSCPQQNAEHWLPQSSGSGALGR